MINLSFTRTPTHPPTQHPLSLSYMWYPLVAFFLSSFVQGDSLIFLIQEIRKKIEDLHFEDCRVLVSQVDSQISANNGILVQVLGEMCNMDGPLQKFSQTFFLAPQINGYYVLNDIFRFLKDEVNIDYYTCDEEKAAAAEIAEKDQEEQKEAADISTAKPITYPSVVESDSTAATTSSTPVIEAASVTTNTQSPVVAEEKPAPATTEKPAVADKSKVTEGKDQEKTKDQEQSSKAPKTWSNIAAGSDNKWGSSSSSSPSATAATATTTTPAAAAATTTTTTATATPTTTTPATTTTNATPAAETKPSQGNKPSHGKDHGKDQTNKGKPL